MSGLLTAVALAVAVAPVDQQALRLAGLARAWGYVKYVHPTMATSTIDWDSALIRSIPAVESAASEDEYRKAIAGLLAELHDPATRVVENEPAQATAGAATAPVQMRLETVDAQTAVLVIPNDRALESTPDLQSEVCTRFTEASRFERVVLDLRSRTARSAPSSSSGTGSRARVARDASLSSRGIPLGLSPLGPLGRGGG